MQLIDHTGQRFGRWLVVERASSRGRQTFWLVRCDCGTKSIVNGASLRCGDSRSCGCLRAEQNIINGLQSASHGHRPRSGESRTYSSWHAMRQRCTNPNAANYRYYGARGVAVCQRWVSFAAFLADMGERPEGTTLDRIDPHGDYEPSNCRWADPATQTANRRLVTA